MQKGGKNGTIRLFFTAPPNCYVLFGPRETGKSTWLRQSHLNAIYFDLIDQEVFHEYLACPERLGEMISGSSPAKTSIIDEIQKVPRFALPKFSHKCGSRRTGSDVLIF
ncbi:MAG: AAA family ATPase [Acidobacteria bacterium]|nr:AAA family ATPase [Acidobacteriota bacterium]